MHFGLLSLFSWLSCCVWVYVSCSYKHKLSSPDMRYFPPSISKVCLRVFEFYICLLAAEAGRANARAQSGEDSLFDASTVSGISFSGDILVSRRFFFVYPAATD